VFEGMGDLLLSLFVYRVVDFSITVNLTIDFSVQGTHLSCVCLVLVFVVIASWSSSWSVVVLRRGVRRRRVVVFVVGAL
jgi:hypothetical protein